MLTQCPHCGTRLKGLKPRCDACGADLASDLVRVAYAFQREGSAREAMIFRRAVKSAALYHRYEVGDGAPIRYLESNPRVAMVEAPAHPARS